VEEREQIFRIHLEKRVQNINTLDIRELAQNSQGYTGAEIEQVVKDAVVTTFNELHEGEDPKQAEEIIEGLISLEVAQGTLLKSVRNITPLSVLKKEEVEQLRTWSHQRARPASKSLFLQRAEALTEAEKRNIAMHEAGHTIMMKHHFGKTPVFISLDNYRNFTSFVPVDESLKTTFTKKSLMGEIGVILGGMVAEEETSGSEAKTVGASHDLIEATVIARKMVVEYGFGEIMSNKSLIALQDFALTSGSEVLDDIQKILDNARDRTTDVITANKDVMLALADELLGKVLMNSDAIERFFAANPITDAKKVKAL